VGNAVAVVAHGRLAAIVLPCDENDGNVGATTTAGDEKIKQGGITLPIAESLQKLGGD
jgi:hypothetical protein